MNERRITIAAIITALTAALARLAPLGWLHPLNWDEIEFYRATRWIAEGRVPFRDFWEHHAPLSWFVFAPFSLLTDSPGVDAVMLMRWAQIPVWIAAFWLANVYMRNAGLAAFARWAAMSLALSSSFLMISAIEYRVDPLACALYLAGLVLAQRGTPRAMFGAGVMFCLTGLTNIRVGPLLVVTVLLLRVLNVREKSWRGNREANWIFAGGIAALMPALLYFYVTKSFAAMRLHLFTENILGDRYASDVIGQFLHRVLIPFGVHLIDGKFNIATVDPGGMALLILGFTGLVLILIERRREPDDLFAVALFSAVNLIVVAGMNFVFHYHMQLTAMLMLPMVAYAVGYLGSHDAADSRGTEVPEVPRYSIVVAVLMVAWCVNLFASFFRGKELDLAYQDFVMRELHARTKPDEKVFGGIAWALRREPAYHFWFLPDMTRHLVRKGHAAPYRMRDVLRDPPAAVVMDYNAQIWVRMVQRQLGGYFVRHYVPVWRNLWIPAMNIRLASPQQSSFNWIVPRDGTYRLFVSPELARHPWFEQPLFVGGYEAQSAPDTEFVLPPPNGHPELYWWIDRQRVDAGATIALRKGQRLAVQYHGREPLGVILLTSDDTRLFRQPPAGATLEASTPRETHWPRFGVRLQR
jgi:hypothetical protein